MPMATPNPTEPNNASWPNASTRSPPEDVTMDDDASKIGSTGGRRLRRDDDCTRCVVAVVKYWVGANANAIDGSLDDNKRQAAVTVVENFILYMCYVLFDVYIFMCRFGFISKPNLSI